MITKTRVSLHNTASFVMRYQIPRTCRARYISCGPLQLSTFTTQHHVYRLVQSGDGSTLSFVDAHSNEPRHETYAHSLYIPRGTRNGWFENPTDQLGGNYSLSEISTMHTEFWDKMKQLERSLLDNPGSLDSAKVDQWAYSLLHHF